LYFSYPPAKVRVIFPDGKRFAFTIIDDTDQSTLERIEPVYELLARYGLRTTKTVWVMDSTQVTSNPANRGSSLRDAGYRAFVLDLQRKGFEIALHGVRGGSSRREEILAGLEEFKRVVGHYPNIHVNHSLNRDNIYWGPHRWSVPPLRWAYSAMRPQDFSGHEPSSDYFWGDVVQRHIKYVRQFTYHEINLLNVNPSFPYRLPEKPLVNYWFPTSHGSTVTDFNELLQPENLDRLEREGGVSLVYAHLGAGRFSRNGRVDPVFAARIRDLASRPGWFVPASTILDHLMRQSGWSGTLSFRDKMRLETRFAARRLFTATE
jgi:hypothetical protein